MLARILTCIFESSVSAQVCLPWRLNAEPRFGVTIGAGDFDLNTPQVRSLVRGQGRILPGPDFVPPPPTFLVSSTSDTDCPPKKHSDHYARAVLDADVPLVYMRDDFGNHGFALKEWWARPCLSWLQERGFGRKSSPQPAKS